MPGAADWNTPTLGTAYATVLSNLMDRDVDAITLQKSAPSNLPVGAIKWNRANSKFQEWDGAVFNDMVIAIGSGGTGAATAAAARTSLGLGDMATQSSASVSISGGTISAGVSIAAGAIQSGLIAQARLGTGSGGAGLKALFDDQTYKSVSVTIYLQYAADQNADFTATLETLYNLTGAHILTLPTVVGQNGKRVGIVNKGGSAWTVTPQGGETILGGATWSFDFGQYSSALLVADANGLKWDVY